MSRVPRRRSSRTLYDTVAEASAATVITGYSTSFGLASRLLAEPVRTHVRNVYALVRIADEIVDCPDSHLPVEQRELHLKSLEEETYDALRTGYSVNLVVHAFARTARECGIGPELVTPFFASMRADLTVTSHNQASLDSYIYGSAEVVGLMCLRTFLPGSAADAARFEELAPGARRLGAAFQKVNFLRDLASDTSDLGRSYFPTVEARTFDDAQRDRLLDDIDADLAAAAVVIPQLPPSSRRAVAAAHALFAELSRRLRITPAAVITHRRVRVPGPVKARVVADAVLRSGRL